MPNYPSTTTPAAPALHRKSPPTCTLSLAHVSASPFHSQSKSSFKIRNSELNLSTMQLDLHVDFSSIISVPVQVHVVDNNEAAFSAHHQTSATPLTGVRRSKSKKRTHSRRNDINYIPFPTTSASSPVTESSATQSFIYSSRSEYSSHSYNSSSTAPHVLLRASTATNTPQRQQQAGPKRVRKSTVTSSNAPPVLPLPSQFRDSPYASRHATPRSSPESIAPSTQTQCPPIFSPLPQRIQALCGPALGSGVAIQRSPIDFLPERPCSPGPPSDEQQQHQHLSLASLTFLLQDKKQQLKSEESFDPPPYTSPPPPYSASPSRTPSPDSKTHPSSPAVTTRPLPANPTKPSRIPTPVTRLSPTPIVPSQPRRQHISSSDLKVLVYLYRTVMYGVEKRYRAETAARVDGTTTPPHSYSTSAPGTHTTSPSMYHRGSVTHVADVKMAGGAGGSRFGRFPVIEEEEEEGEDDQVISSFSSSERRQQKAELDVQDALLAIRLRTFLKVQGVSEAELDVQFEGEKSAEEDEEDERMMEEVEQEIKKINTGSSAQPDALSQVPDRPIRSSPPPLSPVPKSSQRRSVLSTSYMIAFLLMKHRMTSAPRKGFGGVGSAKDKRGHSRGASSGLRVCSWAASTCDDETVVEELEEEYDSCSVVDWYAGMDY